jgi:hypothetical protein
MKWYGIMTHLIGKSINIKEIESKQDSSLENKEDSIPLYGSWSWLFIK